MKKSILIITLLFFISSSAIAADPWDSKDKALAVTMATLLIVDWGQTINISRDPTYHEINPILGRHPSEQSVHMYMGAALVGALTISHVLPSKYRQWFMGSVIALELPYVYNNYQIGLRMQF